MRVLKGTSFANYLSIWLHIGHDELANVAIDKGDYRRSGMEAEVVERVVAEKCDLVDRIVFEVELAFRIVKKLLIWKQKSKASP